jgi:hypothetical protein
VDPKKSRQRDPKGAGSERVVPPWRYGMCGSLARLMWIPSFQELSKKDRTGQYSTPSSIFLGLTFMTESEDSTRDAASHLLFAFGVEELANQIKSNQIKSNQIKSNQIKSNQIKSNQIKSNQISRMEASFDCLTRLIQGVEYNAIVPKEGHCRIAIHQEGSRPISDPNRNPIPNTPSSSSSMDH